MATTKEIGDKGEKIASEYLKKEGYALLEKNWRFSRAEIDLIAKEGEILVFVEVKALSYAFYKRPEEAVTATKEALIMDAAQRYMEKIGHEWEIRFDIISIILDKNLKIKELEHFKDAFF